MQLFRVVKCWGSSQVVLVQNSLSKTKRGQKLLAALIFYLICHKGSRNHSKPIWWRNGPFTWIAKKNAYFSQPQLSMFSTPLPRSKFRHPAEATSAYLASGGSAGCVFLWSCFLVLFVGRGGGGSIREISSSILLLYYYFYNIITL